MGLSAPIIRAPRRSCGVLILWTYPGAFTGATTDWKSYFDLADRGTLCLDEAGNMDQKMQAKLLRVLEDGIVAPVGGTREKQVNVRVLAVTNADLRAKMAAGVFRSDFYYWLAAFTVTVPPLHEHPEDIPLLASHFFNVSVSEMGIEKTALSAEALTVLTSYDFHGNIRELNNIIEHALIQSSGQTIAPEHLPFVCTSSTSPISELSPNQETACLRFS